jgi:hypothetical protein
MKYHAKSPVLDVERVVGMRESQKHSRVHSWDNWHNNDSNIDPSLMLSQSNPSKAYTNFIHDSSSSDDGHQRSFLLPESRRGSMVPDPVQTQVHREQSNPPIATQESCEPPSERLRTKCQATHVPGKISTVTKENMTSNNTAHKPNSSRTRTTRSIELLKVDETERSLRSSEVQKALNADPTHFSRSLEGSSNFSRPRFPGQSQAQEPGRSYLKNSLT